MQPPDVKFWIAILIQIVFLYFSFRLAIKTNLIKDDSIQIDKPYSFGKTQLFWWTVIIISEFIWCSVKNAGVPQLTSLCLALLGISAGTTATASLIDNADKNTRNVERHQDINRSSGFIKDILSDAQGNYSIHRFQSLIFNLSIGLIFLWNFFNSDMTAFPTFHNNNNYILPLLGISDLGYAGLKIGENAPRKDIVADLKATGNTDDQIRNLLKP